MGRAKWGMDAMETDDNATDLDAVADRLESALDRIALRLDQTAAPPPARDAAAALRLDDLIERLRDVLGRVPD